MLKRPAYSYTHAMRRTLVPLTTSRVMPYCGITFLLALTAHNRASDVALIAYVLAVFSVLSVVTSMSLGATGNLVAEYSADTPGRRRLFQGGFGVALAMALVALLVGSVLVSVVIYLPGAQMETSKIHTLALIYTAAIPLLVINTFLHFFHEASGDAAACSAIKSGSTALACVCLCIAYGTSGSDNFIYWAMGYFIFSEAVLLVCLLGLSWRRQLCFSPVYCRRTVQNIINLGLPIAFGLAGQKLYFYLLNEKLATLTFVLVAQLSVYMSVMGLLMIPVVAYCQAHSLYISGHAEQRSGSYAKGQVGLGVGVVLILCMLLWGGPLLFCWLGGSIVTFDRDAFVSMAFLLASSAILSLSTAHLRGLRDTLASQLVMNVLMLSVLVPIIYFAGLGSADIHFYLRLQSGGLLMGFIALQLRIRHMHAKAGATAATVCLDE